jgi:predicted Zn finger-like uncharacterized protein
MKIACESCGAKYSIADEKVQGKVFKIRCKRCSEVIVVRGDGQGGGASPAAAASTPAGEAIWHVVINGDQAGPYSPEQLADMLAGGTVDWDAYVWTEGFDNWVPMRDVETLVAQISGGGSAASAQADARMSFAETPDAFSSAQPAFGGQPSMGADPFADEPPTTAFGGNIGGEPDLFGGGGRAQATPFDSGGHVVASSPSPRTAAAAPIAAAAAADAMTGARNENSVLFSLKNLQALATGSGPSGIPASATAAASSAGYAGGEGSGLIDIRALASATGMGEGESKDAKDELLSIGNQGAFGALGSPMLAPAHDDDGGSKKMMIWAGVAVFGMLLAAGVAAVFIMTRQPAAAPGVGVAPGPVPVAPAPAPSVAADPQDAPSEGELAARAAAEKEQGGTPTERSGSSGTRRPKSEGEGAKPAVEAKPEPVGEKAPPKPSGPRSIDDLLDGALGGPGGSKPKPAPAPVASNLPDLPSRDDVVSAMSGVKNAVSACAQGQTGVAFVNVSVAGATGRVTAAEVSGITGPAGSCIAKAVRAANFPKFQTKVFKVKYPFKL